LYVSFSYPVEATERIVPYLPEHLRYMATLEDQMTVLHGDSEVKAAELFSRNRWSAAASAALT
jgi:hypothetical protein